MVIDGKAAAAVVLSEVQEAVMALGRHGVTPGLHVVLVGDDAASEIYVRNKEKACRNVGIRSMVHRLPADIPEDDVLALIGQLNRDPDVDGVLVQLPLPPQMSAERAMEAIDPQKDVDGFHPLNLGLLFSGRPHLEPCTPAGVMGLLDFAGVRLEGKRAVVVGRSLIVGRPVAMMLLGRNATVTLCHSRTKDLRAEVERAEVLVVAIGRPFGIPGEWIRPGAVVIDVGINRLPDGRLVGDVEYEKALLRASMITPVPGGVGPMTTAFLLRNTVIAACERRGIMNPWQKGH